MTEVEKMRSSQLADMSAPELQVRFEHAKKLLARMRGMSTYDEGYRELLEKLVPGIPETMRAHTMKLTRRSMLNRSVAGISGDTLIVNLPGKAQAVKESLRFLLPELVHAVKVIKGEA